MKNKIQKELISKAVEGISDRYVQEAEIYMAKNQSYSGYSISEKDMQDKKLSEHFSERKFLKKTKKLKLAAAVLVLCILAGGIGMMQYIREGSSFGGILPFGKWVSSEEFFVNAYACGTDGEITSDGVVMDTGSVNDKGEQTGHPLMFYLSGEKVRPIDTVRFSCEKQQLSFRDWTEQRDEYGLARNFTVPYGEHTEEYYYLTIDWEPKGILEAIDKGSTIAALPEELREDRIVMEITFSDGKTAVKEIRISLLEDGTFFAVFEDYTIQESDTFVQRADDLSLREESEKKLAQRQEQKKTEDESEKSSGEISEVIEATQDAETAQAAKAVREYYAGTVFEVISLDVTSIEDEKVVFSVCVSKGGIIQEPNRRIILERKEEGWEVTNEGY